MRQGKGPDTQTLPGSQSTVAQGSRQQEVSLYTMYSVSVNFVLPSGTHLTCISHGLSCRHKTPSSLQTVPGRQTTRAQPVVPKNWSAHAQYKIESRMRNNPVLPVGRDFIH